ncbi:MAG: hypothetical protein CTY20_07885 [Hyphomicrobium sp.]|nr:MAG: hypothetical protein CTY20_07885 [Hyphomicrobium sp.]
MSELSHLLKEIDALKKAVRAVENKQIFSRGICDQLHATAQSYFANLRPDLAHSDKVAAADKLFTQMHELSRKSPSRQKCIDLLADARRALVRIEGAVLSQSAGSSESKTNEVDALILSSLNDVCPAASASYQQALEDMAQSVRISWRGSATELREALRETLDKLAPDKEVEAEPNYKPEPNAQRPTMKQKVRFILKSRGLNSSQVTTSEDTTRFIEESLGGITRSIYNRSSVSTHTPTTREEVVRIHALVRLVLCELLAIPLG